MFEFRDFGEIEAFVLAADQDDATELFEEHVLAHGGDPDSLLWREWPIGNLGEPEQTVIREAMGLGREGLLTCDAGGRWAFTTPIGGGRTTE